MDAYVQTLTPLNAMIGAAAQLAFPSLAIGLASYLAVLEVLWVASRNETFRALYGFWSRIFAVCLLLSVVATLTIGHAVGWSWSGPQLLAAIVAIGCLALAMLAGHGRIGAPSHVLVSITMAVLLMTATVWIVTLQHEAPSAGGSVAETLASFVLGAFLATSLLVAAVSAARLLRRPDEAASAIALRMSVGMVAICAPLRLAVGGHAWSLPAPAGVGPSPLEAVLGAAVVSLALWAAWLVRRRGGPERSRPFLHVSLAMGATGMAALMAGWMASRLGSAASPSPVVGSLAVLGLWAAYILVFGAGGYLIVRLAARPFDEPTDAPGQG